MTEERHYALNWLIGHKEQTWDHVATPNTSLSDASAGGSLAALNLGSSIVFLGEWRATADEDGTTASPWRHDDGAKRELLDVHALRLPDTTPIGGLCRRIGSGIICHSCPCFEWPERTSMPTKNVVLTKRQEELIETLVKSGRYQNASEVLREGLRLVEQRAAEDASRLKALRAAARVRIDALERASSRNLKPQETCTLI